MNDNNSKGSHETPDAMGVEQRNALHARTDNIPEVIIGSHFKMIWITITSLSMILAMTDILLSVLIKHPNPASQQAIAMCDSFAKVGFGGIFGMIGAKALR